MSTSQQFGSTTKPGDSASVLSFQYSDRIPPVATVLPARQTPGKAAEGQVDWSKVAKLFHPITFRGLTLKNRVVVSPMCMYSSKEGVMTDYHLVHLGSFALGGAGLVIFEASGVQARGRISPDDAGIWDDKQIPQLKRIVDFVHSQNAAAGIQLAHAGRKASTFGLFQQEPGKKAVADEEHGGWPHDVWGPSAIPYSADYPVPKEMSLADIEQLKQDFVAAAHRAEAAGFDMIELHAAHGYLLTSFLSPISNHRTDQYGGSFENRTRLLLETVTALRQAWPQDKPLSVRLTCHEWVEGGWSIDDTVALVEKLKDLKVDIIDCSSGGNSPNQKITVGPSYQVQFARAVKQAVGDSVAVMTVGEIFDAHQAEEILQNGEADLVALARELLRNPNWTLKAAVDLGTHLSSAPQYQRSGLITWGRRRDLNASHGYTSIP